MILAIHPAQIEWADAVARGEKVLYHWEMRLLHCFSLDFNPGVDPYLSHWVFPGMHELLYPFDKKKMVGVTFWCLDGLLRDTDLIATQDAEGNLSPLAIFEHGVRWLETSHRDFQTMLGERKKMVLKDNEMGAEFLRQYPLMVPYVVWSRALPKVPDA